MAKSSPKKQKRAAWTPQPGPQLSAIEAKMIEELFFGGARYGGKSDFLLGDFLQDVDEWGENWQGVIFRESLTELEHIIHRSHQFYPLTGAEWKEQKKQWVWPNGACLRMRYFERESDIASYMGHSYCVGVDTPILMGDGSSKAIKDVVVGDLVMTLEGPKPVTEVLAPYETWCVEVDGQIQPVDHPILTDGGWQSYASLRGICSKDLESLGREFRRLPSVNVSARRFLRNFRHVGAPQRSYAATLFRVLGRFDKLFDESSLAADRLVLMTRLALAQVLGPSRYGLGYSVLRPAGGGSACAPLDFQIQRGFPGDYRLYPYSRGEQLLFRLASALNALQLQAGVEGRSHSDLRMGGEGTFQGCNQRHLSWYEHPYTGEFLESGSESDFRSFSISPVGRQLVMDLTVSDSNHYVNADNGLISKNTWIGIDELGNWADEKYYKLIRTCLRWANVNVPCKRIRATGNPGGVGQHWIYEYFIGHAPLGYKIKDDPITKKSRIYIPSRVHDNKIGLKNDPAYIDSLRDLGSPEMVKAWLEGDWTAMVGAYFTEFSLQKHVVPPCYLPKEWTRFCAFDWGSYHPFVLGWFAVSDGSPVIQSDSSEIWFPEGAIVMYRELYGAKGPNKGLELSAEEAANQIRLRMPQNERISYMVADPSMFKRDGGKSVAERMGDMGLRFRRADNERVAGWSALRSRLRGQDGETPDIYFFSNCPNTIRTIPALQHADNNPEDVMKKGDDHCGDMVRYACMSRPHTTTKERKQRAKHQVSDLTLNDLWDISDGEQAAYRLGKDSLL